MQTENQRPKENEIAEESAGSGKIKIANFADAEYCERNPYPGPDK